VGLAALGHKAGLLDADVYGPNVPLMMGINQTPMASAIAYSRCNSTASNSCRWAF
jgi:Mrp family chromosome partitioning ATPase